MSGVRPHRRLRRALRGLAVAGALAAAALIIGPATAVAIVVVGALVWGLWRWPRWEARLFEPSRDVEVCSPLSTPRSSESAGAGLGPAGHRAFARAMHAVTEAYLAECEREAER